eukprot:CAMPEP_0198287396 /NCGR_PEP_ID=MMETSP1449-20131203/6231_1 /TAXON_ID=420275 /ORGANISM="Attheya septentrionalis, Strain CCMP2084" /LENGTH=586 /DNA_ID=CAMNT_0043985347 /DNA_START=78 /DNA_END=1834 /DNA_ORIENTATION=-
MSSEAEKEIAAVQTLLIQLSNQTAVSGNDTNTNDQQKQQNQKQWVEQLAVVSNPRTVMNVLAPHLFLQEAGVPVIVPSSSSSSSVSATAMQNMTCEEALPLLMQLVTAQPDQYLLPASRAIQLVARDLAKSSQQHGVLFVTLPVTGVSDELLTGMVSQLTAAPQVEVSTNTATALKDLCLKFGPPLSTRVLHAMTTIWNSALHPLPSSSSNTNNASSKLSRSEASTLSVRCASMAVDLAVQGDAPMKVFMTGDDSTGSSSSLSQLLLEILSDDTDPLLQMSALDCLEIMSTTVPMHKHRAHWLVSNQVIAPLLSMTGAGSDDEEEEPNLLLSGPALRLLSSICQLGQRDSTLFQQVSSSSGSAPQPQQQLLQTGFHRALLRACEGLSGGELDRLAFVDAVSSYASASPEALVLVLDDLVLKQKWLSLHAAQPKLKSIILLSVARVMDPPPPDGVVPVVDVIMGHDDDDTRNVPSNAMANRLLGALSEMNRDKDAIELILDMATASPWVEERLGSYALLKAIAQRGRQGIQTLFLHAGFLEFVTSRDQTAKEGKEAKFEIIQAILQNDAGKELLAEPIVQQLETMMR